MRSLLHARGLRFRVDYPITVPGRRPIRPDIVFPRARVAVQIMGCWWHGCPEHGRRTTRSNAHYWGPKIARNVERDAEQDEALITAGWTVLRFWEHERPRDVAETIARDLSMRAKR